MVEAASWVAIKGSIGTFDSANRDALGKRA